MCVCVFYFYLFIYLFFWERESARCIRVWSSAGFFWTGDLSFNFGEHVFWDWVGLEMCLHIVICLWWGYLLFLCVDWVTKIQSFTFVKGLFKRLYQFEWLSYSWVLNFSLTKHDFLRFYWIKHLLEMLWYVLRKAILSSLAWMCY